jgi:thioredoxin reductase
MHGFLSRDGADPAEVRRAGREQLRQYDSVEVRDEEVIDVTRDGRFLLSLADGGSVSARRLLLTAGMRDELPLIDGLTRLWGHSAFPCPYCDGWEVRDQPLFALGRGTNGMLFALLLSKWSGDVLLCTNGPAELDEGPRRLLASRGVRVHEEVVGRVESVNGGGVEVVFSSSARLRRRALFAHPVLRQASDVAERLGCAMTDDGAIEVSALGETSVPGVYAAGDAARPRGLPFPAAFVVVAAAQGATAAAAIDRDLLLEDLGLADAAPTPAGSPARQAG